MTRYLDSFLVVQNFKIALRIVGIILTLSNARQPLKRLFKARTFSSNTCQELTLE